MICYFSFTSFPVFVSPYIKMTPMNFAHYVCANMLSGGSKISLG